MEGYPMSKNHLLTVLKTSVIAAALVVVGLSIAPSTGRADTDSNAAQDEQQMITIGLKMAPVTLNIGNVDPALVGLGSYLVNFSGDCNGCHSAGATTEFTGPGNPYLLTPPSGPFSGTNAVNPATYLAGGQDFGVFPSPGNSVHIVSRNITPDKTGMAAGGMTVDQFLQVMKTGVDLHQAHLNCDATHTTNCLTPPFNGALLQVMPWPSFKNMTDHQLRAIYLYLSSIPCIEGGPGVPSPRCS
jgi:hypothetical protein